MQRDALNLTSIYTSRHILFKSFYFGGCTLQSHWPSSTRFSPTWILTEEIWTWSNLVALSTTYFVFCCWGHVGMIGCRKVAVNEWNKRVIYSSVYKKNKPLLYILQRLNIYKESDDTDLYQNSLSDFFFFIQSCCWQSHDAFAKWVTKYPFLCWCRHLVSFNYLRSILYASFIPSLVC